MKKVIVTLLLDESHTKGSVDLSLPVEEQASIVSDRLASFCGLADPGYVIEFCNPYGEWYKVEPVHRLIDVGVEDGYYFRLSKNSSILSAPLLKTDMVGWQTESKRTDSPAAAQEQHDQLTKSGFVWVPLD